MVSHPTSEPNTPISINKQTTGEGNGHTLWCLITQVSPCPLDMWPLWATGFCQTAFSCCRTLHSHRRQPQTNTNQQESHIKRGHPIVFGLILFFALIEGCITAWLGTFSILLETVHILMAVSRFNSDDNYPNNSYRDRIRFLLFVSWWTVVFTAGYLAFFIINAGSFLVSIASHGIFLALT